MSGLTGRFDIHSSHIKDVSPSRRSVLRSGGALLAGAAIAPFGCARQGERLSVRSVSPAPDGHLWGMALSYGQQRLDLIDLDGAEILHSFDGFHVTHAITPIEALNRFVVHGVRYGPDAGGGEGFSTGAVLVIDVDPVSKAWQIVLYEDLPGGVPLHWQPNRAHTEVMFNSTGDGSLHVLDTASLEVESFHGGGEHSNMAFFDNYLVATDALEGPTRLLITDRDTDEVVAETPVGTWGHGVTVNFERGEAFVWSKEGGHRISLAQKTMGRRLGKIAPFEDLQRSWFCWTPQGGRYTHDAAWNKGDVYDPYLMVVDLEAGKCEQIPTGDAALRPSYLQVSPDGKWGLAALQGREEVGIFDLSKNEFHGVANCGPARAAFFERDMSFCRNRDFAMVTNTGDTSISLLDLKAGREVRRIHLPRRPAWFKAISPI